MNKSIRKAAVVAFFWAAATPAYAVPKSVPIEKQVEDVVSHLVGVMDTSAQAAANPGAANVRMTTCEVTVENADTSLKTRPSVFLYQEQALSRNLAKPYRQRFLRIAPSADGESVESRSFRPPTPETLIGLCDRPKTRRVISSNNLGEVTCSVFLKPVGENYVGQTPPEGCPTNYRGAVKITNTITLHKTGMDTEDRGFDEAGNRVWGAKEQSYQFRWMGK
ncbi:MAG: chromophore lyase CpcT/CpeT [Cyanobacteriota bacterium]